MRCRSPRGQPGTTVGTKDHDKGVGLRVVDLDDVENGFCVEVTGRLLSRRVVGKQRLLLLAVQRPSSGDGVARRLRKSSSNAAAADLFAQVQQWMRKLLLPGHPLAKCRLNDGLKGRVEAIFGLSACPPSGPRERRLVLRSSNSASHVIKCC